MNNRKHKYYLVGDDIVGEYERLNKRLRDEQQRLKELKEEIAICPDDEFLYEEIMDAEISIGEIKGALLEMAEVDGLDDPYEAFDYCPSSTNGDYSPSNPWDAPGMSISDFI